MRAAQKGLEFARCGARFDKRWPRFADGVKVENHERQNEHSEQKSSTTELVFEKISSPTISGDFGVRVSCARSHHFFLDITFY
jgi:hypothetical protein